MNKQYSLHLLFLSLPILNLVGAEWCEGRSDCSSVRPQRGSLSTLNPGGESYFWAESAEAGPVSSGRNRGNPSASQ